MKKIILLKKNKNKEDKEIKENKIKFNDNITSYKSVKEYRLKLYKEESFQFSEENIIEKDKEISSSPNGKKSNEKTNRYSYLSYDILF